VFFSGFPKTLNADAPLDQLSTLPFCCGLFFLDPPFPPLQFTSLAPLPWAPSRVPSLLPVGNSSRLSTSLALPFVSAIFFVFRVPFHPQTLAFSASQPLVSLLTCLPLLMGPSLRQQFHWFSQPWHHHHLLCVFGHALPRPSHWTGFQSRHPLHQTD